jgi:hypothetical protein
MYIISPEIRKAPEADPSPIPTSTPTFDCGSTDVVLEELLELLSPPLVLLHRVELLEVDVPITSRSMMPSLFSQQLNKVESFGSQHQLPSGHCETTTSPLGLPPIFNRVSSLALR